MKIEILKDCKASRDGIYLEFFSEGEVLSVHETFGDMMISGGFAGYYKEYRVNPPEEIPEKHKRILKRNKG